MPVLAADVIATALSGIGLGVVSGILGLALLFAIKPRLRIELEKDERACRFRVENTGLSRVVELRARLWLMTRTPTGWARDPVSLLHDDLFVLNGKWREARRSSLEMGERRGDPSYRFLLDREECGINSRDAGAEASTESPRRGGADADYLAQLVKRGARSSEASSTESERLPTRYLLFQVWCKHGFTNVGRVHRGRFIVDQHGALARQPDPDERETPRWPVSVTVRAIAWLGTQRAGVTTKLDGDERMRH
jgi:hypothetical protein